MVTGYVGEPKPELADLDKCTRCGLCEQACPTYRVLHFEPDSPRGRIFLMKQVAEGAGEIDEHFARHLYQCLGCRACETVCPAGVPYGRLLERARYQIELNNDQPAARRGWRRFRAFAFEQILPRRWLFTLCLLPARALQSVPPLLRLLQALPLPRGLANAIRMIPQGQSVPLPREKPAAPASTAARKPRVGLFLGCVQRVLFERVHRATIRVLLANGCEVVIPKGQWCCGALNVHAGERRFAARMTEQNVRAFSAPEIDVIVVNSAGCGAAMKEYAELLDRNSEAAAFATKVQDVTEFLAGLDLRRPQHPLRERVTYQDACHLAHGQKIRRQPRELLKAIPGLDFVEMSGADECCGAAGAYSLTQPHLARAVLERKLDQIAATGAGTVATTNPGCAIQLETGLRARGSRVRVCHVVELLAEAY